MKSLILKFSCAIFFLLSMNLKAEDGYKLWLRYAPITDQDRFEAVKSIMDQMIVSGASSTFEVIREELFRAASGSNALSQYAEELETLYSDPLTCLLYFQQFSQRPFPSEIVQPEGDLESYQKLKFPYAPGIRPSW